MDKILLVLIALGVAISLNAEKGKGPTLNYQYLGSGAYKKINHYRYTNDVGYKFEVVTYRDLEGAGVSIIHLPTCNNIAHELH